MPGVPLQYNTFANGLITDYNEVNFPENALSKAINVEIKVDNSIARRKGLGTISTLPAGRGKVLDSLSIAVSGKNYIIILSDSGYVDFIDVDNNFNVVNSQSVNTINATTVKGSLAANSKGVYISVQLDAAHKFFYIPFLNNGAIGTLTSYNVVVRDLFGDIPKGYNEKARPASLTDVHKYNLQNQGWFKTVKNYSDGASGTDVKFFKADTGVYPSLQDDPNLGIAVNAAASDETRFRAINITGEAYSTLIASAKGAIKYSPFLDGEPVATSLSLADTAPFPQDQINKYLVDHGKISSTPGYAEGMEVFSSRVFYAGFKEHAHFNGTVIYSKILEKPEDAAVCYQDADPTSATASDPLDTDGGYIRIPEAGNIFALKAVGEYLYVFASNGVWAIFGDTASGGFTHLNHSVTKVSSIPAYSKQAITEVAGALVYIGVGGIYTLVKDKVSGVPIAQSIIKDKLDNWFREVPDADKRTSIASYDKETDLAYFIFGGTKVLVLNVSTGAFFEYNTKVSIDNVLELPYVKMVSITTSNNGYPVGYEIETVSYSTLMIVGENLCQFINNGYYDIDPNTGVYDSEFSIGPFNFKDLYRTKQVFRLISQFRRTETVSHEDANGDIIIEDESSCYTRPVWDYSSSTLTGKVGNWIQLYASPRFVSFEPTGTYEYDVHQTKRRLRGSGKALKLEFKSEGNKHFNLLGYALEAVGRQRG